MKTALYIPCFNAQRDIRSCLDAVFSQSRQADDILVVDDGSSDTTADIAEEYPVRIIRHARNLGLAAARNSAIKNTDADLIASLDSDCLPDKDWFSYLFKRMEMPNIAGAGGKMTEADTSGLFDKWRSVHMGQHWGNSKRLNPPFLFGSNTLFRRKLLLSAGSYNEKYRSNYEDVDISIRLRKKGFGLFYEPRAVVKHLKKDDMFSLLNNFWKWNFTYYIKEGFYKTPERFAFKLKDNIGLSNRFLEEDLTKKRHRLVYLDFLIALHHSLRDFDYFSFRGKKKSFDIAAPSKMSVWISFLDLDFFYHWDSAKRKLSTLVPKEKAFQQSFFALNLILSIFMKSKFGEEKFNERLRRHLFMSVFKIEDELLLNKMLNLAGSHQDWEGLLNKKHPNIDNEFLTILSSSFREWVEKLLYRFPGIVKIIKKSAEEAEKTISAA
ncbi:MAG: glycosyltransferase family 2 protein [Candidatus Omnitrophica bacterium]|nr:glycosyltransferase family 2 protein [Candidatus Omnitrophota bacterium]MDD5771410.1 glycosyltransferase family 2 protein [Candidatus Omnitrophota bacterium]